MNKTLLDCVTDSSPSAQLGSHAASRRPKLTVVSPTYNEAENVEPLISRLERSLDGLDYEIIISDDDSPDRTWARVEAIGKLNERVRAIRRLKDRGLGASVLDGFRAAQGEIVACIDADLQHDPTILREMLKQIEEGADLVVATRYMPGGGTANWNPVRRLGSSVATGMAKAALGIPLRDPMSGYFMLRREDFMRIAHQLNGNGFKILLEIAARLKPQSLREVPYTFGPRVAGESKLTTKIVIAYLRQLCALSLRA